MLLVVLFCKAVKCPMTKKNTRKSGTKKEIKKTGFKKIARKSIGVLPTTPFEPIAKKPGTKKP
jgi:hypothetical protein